MTDRIGEASSDADESPASLAAAHAAATFRFCCAALGSAEHAIDAVAATFRAARDAGARRPRGPAARAWLIGVARGVCAGRIESAAVGASQEGGRSKLEQALWALKPSLREAILARTAGGLTWAEVGVAFGVDQAVAIERASRGLMQLGAAMEPGGASVCGEVERDLAALADGAEGAVARHSTHLASCESCRDARHDARRWLGELEKAASAIEPPVDLVSRLNAAVEAPGDGAANPETAPGASLDAPADGAAAPVRRPLSPGRAMLLVLTPIVGLAVGVAVVMTTSGPHRAPERTVIIAAPQVRVARVVRSAADGRPGLFLQQPGGPSESPLAAGAAVAPGAMVRSDERTRASLDLPDGVTVILDHLTRLENTGSRGLKLHEGEVMVETAQRTPAPLAVALALGRVELDDAKACVATTGDTASVRVLRGQAVVRGRHGTANVPAGHEALIEADGRVSVTAAVGLPGAGAWSELEPVDGDADSPGLGELRARRPGDSRDRERPLRLAEHKVTIRVLGPVARTEIDETFQNEGGDTLEGIYRFPLPADAQIERLALEVDGQLQEGAFVDRERAAAIWRGVMHHAAPKQLPKPKEEMVWVPGPWRDPALLQWQRGGRFELRIYPIQPHRSRRVIVAYTQAIAPVGAIRRYTYPLPHAANAASQVGHFQLDARVTGADPAVPVVARGYDEIAFRREEGATAMSLDRSTFLPAGDLVIDYRLPAAETELRAFTYRRAPDEPAYVMFALRPRLPAWTETKGRDHVLIVDSSQSMTGERYARASRLAVALAAEMDRRDRFLTIVCDAGCRTMPQSWQTPSSQAANAVRDFLAQVRPAGSSDVVGALRFGAAVAQQARQPGREVKLLYIGDGMSSVGPRTPGAIAAEVTSLRSGARELVFSAVGVGSDADMGALEAVARSGDGHVTAYRPGERLSAVAARVLDTNYGVSLSQVALSLPAGITQMAPSSPGTLREGDELLAFGRFSGAVKGVVELRGTVAGKPWVERYPVDLQASTAPANAFVPRMWAAATIARLEMEAGATGKAQMIELSKKFSVLSRHTSLLVLESPAMMQAFGVEQNRGASQWSGEGELDEVEVAGMDSEPAAPASGALAAAAGIRRAAPARPGSAFSKEMAKRAADWEDPFGGESDSASGARRARAADLAPAAPAAVADRVVNPAPKAEASTVLAEPPAPPRMPQPGRWMRRVWTKEARLATWQPGRWNGAIDSAERALQASPDSRDRHRALVRVLAREGDLVRAREVAERWLERDRLDAEALTALSDVVARQGQRDEALRLLSGIVDLEPDSKPLHERMARAYERLGAAALACAHRVTLAELSPADPVAVGAALRCERQNGWAGGAHVLTRQMPSLAGERAERMAGAAAPSPAAVRGEVVLDAAWSSGEDLDLALISPQGTRISWMGGRAGVVADGVNGRSGERLGLQRVSPGSYLVEISRTAQESLVPVRGRIRLVALGMRQELPFSLTGQQKALATLVVERTSHLEPVSGPVRPMATPPSLRR